MILEGTIGVTIARKATGSAIIEEAQKISREFDAQYIERSHNTSLDELRVQNNLAALIVLERAGLRLHSAAGSFAYHASMAVLRMQQLRRGEQDHFVEALALRRGQRALDCTLGLGADAAIAAHIVGESGAVVGVEASRLVQLIVSHGLKNYRTGDAELDSALRRIKTVHALAEDFLETCTPGSFDVIYFDAMFRHPVKGSKGMEALRPFSYEKILDGSTVKRALAIAPRVVIKERSEKILREYGCEKFFGGRYSSVRYGVLEK